MGGQVKRLSFLRMALQTLAQRNNNNAQEHLQQRPLSPPRPENDDREGWRDYWVQMGQSWRTEPEIDAKRQQYLAERRAIVPEIEKDIYPFKDVKLNRADVEWLLATHEDGRGPVYWSDKKQRKRKGLDLRGADLRSIDLSDLPLARICGGLTGERWNSVPDDRLDAAAVHLEGADLRTHLEDAELSGAHLEQADLRNAHLENAHLGRTHLEGVRLHFAHLESAFLRAAHLERAILYNTNLRKAILVGIYLEHAYLNEAYLEGTHLDDAILSDKRYVGPYLADTHWENTNLAVVEWSRIKILGEEDEARKKEQKSGEVKSKVKRLKEYERAVRANRQLAVALQSQGLNEVAARFAYRAQVLQKSVFRFQILQPGIALVQRLRQCGSWLFSWFLYLLAGYGYRPGRSIIAYLLMICIFAMAYFVFGMTGTGAHHLQWYEALVVSLTAFHGRGFFSEQFQPGDPQAIIAAIEAVVGLVIEISFIATFTQRFFGK